ncbi:hypothetical protein [Desertivirga arenae]|uniref:hypothetical protein n=1 Tax=Desertivirga arenae TaxID=2810309 RepID=UPI001A966BDF|nr:hypothetical protein [Pedobacter sp. SYSU D00823]
MKKYLLIIVSCLTFSTAFSQYNYYKLSAGASIGPSVAFADLSKKRIATTIGANFDYNLTPFTSIGIELQKGTLSGGDRETDRHLRYFKNDYNAASVGIKVQLGQVVDFERSGFLYAIRTLYSGIGLGVIQNTISDGDIVRVQPGTGYVFPGTNKSMGIKVPINAGMNFNLTDRWGYTRCIFNINYQLNITTGEGLDGYNDASKGGAFSNIPDMYGVGSIGFKVCFGPQGLF